MPNVNESSQRRLRRYAKADWNNLVPRLLAYTQFSAERYGFGAARNASLATDYALEAIALLLGDEVNVGRETDRTLFATLAAVVAMLLRRDSQRFQPESVAAEDSPPLIQLASPTDLTLYLASRPDVLHQVQPRKFEEIVGELLADLGYTVELTSPTRDEGIDIIAIGRSSLGVEEKYLVQCKRFARDHHVGVSVVRELLGVGVRWPNTGAMIVTTSTFTSPARALASHETVRWRLHLRDYNDLTQWLHAYAKRRGLRQSGAA